MEKEYLIFGASKAGKAAYMILEGTVKIKGFLDNNPKKEGVKLFELPIMQPNTIDFSRYHVVIASEYQNEMIQQLKQLGCTSYDVFNFNIGLPKVEEYKNYQMKEISVGAFLSEGEKSTISNLSFLNSGSGVLDYFFLKKLAKSISAKNYLEIGTFTGEGILAISELESMGKCYSISLEDSTLEKYFNKTYGKKNFSRYFSRKDNKIIHFEGDSKQFNYAELPHIDLVFIDGDHSFEGVAADTKNIFNRFGFENTIVVWHDYLDASNKMNLTTHQAILSVLNPEQAKNIYIVQNTMCGIFIPEKYKHVTSFKEVENELYSYSISITPKVNQI